MNIDKYYKIIENILESYPSRYSINYYKNKKTLKLEQEEEIVNGMIGGYNPELNKINYSKDYALPHELFHMSFTNRKKLKKEIYKDSNLYCSDGVSFFKYINSKKHIFCKGINEGFVQYLAEKCIKTNGRILEHFFADLLISIYGEDIILYALDNDPLGFITDKRFLNIYDIIINLDNLCDARESIVIMVNFKRIFLEKHNLDEMDKEISTLKNSVNTKYKNSIINLFKCIIKEFNNCINPKIIKEDLICKMTEIFNNPKYSIAFFLDDKKCSVKEEVSSIINEFEKSIKSKKYVL